MFKEMDDAIEQISEKTDSNKEHCMNYIVEAEK